MCQVCVIQGSRGKAKCGIFFLSRERNSETAWGKGLRRVQSMSANSSSGGSLTMSSADSPQPGSGSHILNIRNARMRAESDVTLLRNRLEKLGQEERKALKKIEETRKRAEQIIQLRARNERAHLRKQLEAERSERQRDRRREALQASKNEMSGKVQANVDALQAQKKHDAAVMRDQRALINDYLRVKQQQQLERNRQVTEVPAPRLPPSPPHL